MKRSQAGKARVVEQAVEQATAFARELEQVARESTVQPSRRADTLDAPDDYIDEVLGEGGLLAQRWLKSDRIYEPREGQLVMARGVHSAITTGKPLLVEAGTGTGKSLAVGIPASWWAAKVNVRRAELGLPRYPIVIVTANNALTEQYVNTDFPLMKSLVPWEFTFALMKGRGNYVCVDKLAELPFNKGAVSNPQEVDQMRRIAQWSGITATGDMSELPFEPTPRVRSLFVVGQDDCTGRSCPSYKECFAERHRKDAAQADIVITNYHMLYTDVEVQKVSEGYANVLPPYSIAVFDEAHSAAEIARDFFGFRLTAGKVRDVGKLLDTPATPKKEAVEINPELKQRLAGLASEFFIALRKHFDSDDYEIRITDENVVEAKELLDALHECELAYRGALEGGGWSAVRKKEISRAEERADRYSNWIRATMALADAGKGYVYFLEPHPQQPVVALIAKPLEVAGDLRDNFFENPQLRTTIATSATLQSGGHFDHISDELGAETADELEVDSPFDYAKQCVLIVPEGLPPPNSKDFAHAVAEGMLRVAELSNGGMLGLFTSYRVLDYTHKFFMENGWADRVMKQRDAPRGQLVQRLKDEKGSVLLGTESFWTGVDVPGDALRVVCIDRMPFPQPDDPMLNRYEELHGSRTFKEYSLPRAIIQFRQGFGRLVRSSQDRGVVVCFDTRIVEKPFGRLFLKSLPRDMNVTRSLDYVRPMTMRG